MTATDDAAPLWLHIASWYIGVAIWFSLAVPIRTGRTFAGLTPVGAGWRVLCGLLWPVYFIAMCVVWLVGGDE